MRGLPEVGPERGTPHVAGRKAYQRRQKVSGFYVYAHFRASDGNLFYIGKGTRIRAWSRHSRNRHWRAVVRKHGFVVHIIKDGLSEAQAFRLEELLIRNCGVRLATYAGGGPGTSGYRHSEQARRSMSEKRRGRKVSEETRALLSDLIRSNPEELARRAANFSGENNPMRKPENRAASSIRMFLNNPMFAPENIEKMRASLRGRSHSPEARAKISAALKGRKNGPIKPHVAAALAKAREKRKRPVGTNCGLVFSSMLEAANATGARQGAISNNCWGRTKSAGGYVWRFLDGSDGK